MNSFSWHEFRPTILFLARFVGFYVLGSLLYGLFINAYTHGPDPITTFVSEQCAWLLSIMGWPTHAVDQVNKATTWLMYAEHARLSVYEGCNGINVMIIFVVFLLAFGRNYRAMAWFIPMGLVVIHIGNLARIIILFWVTLYYPDNLYFLHKYFFTAVIYLVVFVLWVVWIRKSLSLRDEA